MPGTDPYSRGHNAPFPATVKPSDITPIILTYDEEPNIQRALEGVSWASQILVLDSFSQDRTLDIASSFPQVRVVQRRFDTFAGQCNFSLEQVSTPWVLSMDADYIVPPGFEEQLESLDDEMAGFEASFRYCVHGRPLRASLYPPRVVLYRPDKAHYVDDGHTQRVQITGPIGMLEGRIDHDDRKPMSRWLASQDRYAVQEAQKLLTAQKSELPLQDKLRRMYLPAPVLAFFYCILVKRVILDGWPGWYYTWQRTVAEVILSLRLLDMKLQFQKSSGEESPS